MKDLRIVSFLPAATEMVCLLGLEDHLVGITHECDYPPEVRTKPVLVDCALKLAGLTPQEIDAAVAARLKSGKSLYEVSEPGLKAAAPTVLITQNLCQVCGPSGNEVSHALRSLSPEPDILWQTPKTFEEMLACVEELGLWTKTQDRARAWTDSARKRVAAVSAKAALTDRTKVSFLEWVDPLFSGGHWISQMLSWAGGEDPHAQAGKDSVRLEWERVLAHQPEVLIVSPCGFKSDKALAQAAALRERPGWRDLPAVRNGRVFAVDGDSYFARPGPRLVDGVELLAHLILPEVFPWRGPIDAYRPVAP